MISRSSVVGAFPTKPLGDVVEFLDSMRRPITESDRRAGPYPYYGANGQQGTIDDFIFDEPLVLLAEDGGHFDNPSRGIAYRVSGKTWVNNHAHVLRANGELDLGFLCRVLENYDVTPWVTGTTRGKLTQAGAAQIIVPIPPLPEQRRIAEILDKADALRAKRRAALDKLDSLAQSIFLDMFGDPATNPKGWRVGRLEDEITSVRYGTGSPPPYVDDGIPFIRATNIKAGTISSKDLKRISPDEAARIEKCRVHADNLIIVRSGVNTGDCAIVPSEYDGAYAAFDLIIELPKANAVFYNFLINSPYGKAHLEPLTRRAAQAHLNAEQVRSLRFISPDEASKQRFAILVGSINKQKVRGDENLRQLGALFSALQHSAFRGEL
jgi:type I restriction enzyme S subunit